MFQNQNKKQICGICYFNIINSLFPLYANIKELFAPSEWMYFLIDIVVCVLLIFVVLSNLSLIIFKDNTKMLLYFNMIVALVQIFKIDIFGFAFEFSSGVLLLLYINNNDGFFAGFNFDLFTSGYSFYYDSSSDAIMFGLNVISVFLFFSYRNLYKIVHLQENISKTDRLI